MLSYHRLEKQANRRERDEIFTWLKINQVSDDVDDVLDDPVLHICYMDGGRVAIRASVYPELLELVHKHGPPNGLRYYFVERLPDSRIARLYIDLDLYVARKELIPTEETMRKVTRVVQRAARDAWQLDSEPAYAVASAKPRAEKRFIGKTTRKLKRIDTTAADLESFFAHEEYEKTVVYKVGIHWIFPSIVDHSDRLRAFAHHLKGVLNQAVDPMKLFGVVAGWNDAVDLGIYKGDGRGAFRLPYCHKAKACPEKPAFRFDGESRLYVATEGGGTRPPTMQCGKGAPPYQGDVPKMAKKYNIGFRSRIVPKERRLPDERDLRRVPDFVGKGRAKRLLSEGVETVVVEGVELRVRCDTCFNEGYVSTPTFYVPCAWSELKSPTDFSIVPFGRIDEHGPTTFRMELMGPMASFVQESQQKGKGKKRERETTRASNAVARKDKLVSTEPFALPPDVSKLFVKMMEAVVFKKRGIEYHPYKDTAATMELSTKVHFRRGLALCKLVDALQTNKEPPVRLWVYDETSFCPVRFRANGRSNCHHASNRSYVEVSCLGYRAQCLDTDDPACYPSGKRKVQPWRTNEHSQAFWRAFVWAGLSGPLSTLKLGFNVMEVERLGMQGTVRNFLTRP
jgi:hypothetical protein